MTTQPAAAIVAAPAASAGTRWRIYAKETKYEFLKLWRMPAFVLPTLLFPVMFYVLFGMLFTSKAGAAGGAASYYLASFGSFAVIAAALFGIGASVAAERGQGWLEVKRASPMPPLAYFAAKVGTSLLFGVVIVLVLFALGAGFSHVRMPLAQAAALAAVEVLGAIPFCAMGLAIGYLTGPNSAPAIVNLIYMPMAFFSGLWIPIEFFPRTLQRLAPALPPYHLGQLALGVIGMGGSEPAWAHLLVLAAFTVLCLAVARAGFLRDEGKLYG
ncbi:MAG TPA: ABC transporter permease [Candidatus Acidoferrales bacterium]|nr:ABC transporter permease [Candidatus Acidoferrales bacterium]